MAEEDHEKIRARARRMWEQEGRPEGRAEEHWARARRQVDAEREDAPPSSAGPGGATTSARSPEDDARGQFVRSRAGAKNDGMSSADPEVLSGKDNGDATFTSDPKRRSTRRQ